MGSSLHQEVEENAAHRFCLDGLSGGAGWVLLGGYSGSDFRVLLIKEPVGSTPGEGRGEERVWAKRVAEQ